MRTAISEHAVTKWTAREGCRISFWYGYGGQHRRRW